MITIGLISDTHGLVRPEIADVFRGVELILHAGDVGGASVLEALRKIAPTDAVYGNVDDAHDPALARERVVTRGGVTIHVSHGHEFGRPSAELVAARYAGDVLVFGHTHKALVARPFQGRGGADSPAPHRESLLVVNPGAAGPRRFDIKPSVARLTIENGQADVQVIWLA
jgi:putative phosphoesterase